MTPTVNRPAPTPAETPTEGRFKTHRRQKVNLSLHPQTIAALTDLAVKFSLPRGVIVDRASMAIWQQYDTGTCHCAHNRPCPHSRTDVPRML